MNNFIQLIKTNGEVAEWLKAHAWKACKRETVSGVRIPSSPHFYKTSLPKYAKMAVITTAQASTLLNPFLLIK